MIKFRENHKKTLEGLVWFAKNAPELTHYWAVKTLFFADLYHLNKYGRPVFGDTICALDFGPAPSAALNMVKREAVGITPQEVDLAVAAFDTIPQGKSLRLANKREPDLDLFSRTDLECLNKALAYCRPLTFSELKDVTHDMPCYKQAWDSRGAAGSVPMDFELMVEDSPNKESLLAYIKECSAGAVF
jgi:uncharacterized phage-associated protein